jgi:hypothetical protein
MRRQWNRASGFIPGPDSFLIGATLPKCGYYYCEYLSMEREMIKAIFAILALVAVASAGSVKAQRFDPAYPVCMHVVGFQGGERMDCMFTSLDQCAGAASGRGGSCLVNPYFAHASGRPRR